MRTNLNAYQTRILFAIWRQTYGWNKKEDWISNKIFVDMTGLKKSHVSRTIKELKERKIITSSGNKIAFNKEYTQWRELPRQATVITDADYFFTIVKPITILNMRVPGRLILSVLLFIESEMVKSDNFFALGSLYVSTPII